MRRCVLLALAAVLLLSFAPAPMQRQKRQPKEIVNSIGMKLALIPAGKFKMGSPKGEDGRKKDEEQHEVEISKAFYVGKYEVTQVQFKRVMGYNPSYYSKDGEGKEQAKGLNADDFPVENVSWDEAQKFIDKLNALPDERGAGRKYRLPTEAEWEYACRGGHPSQAFHFGSSLSSKQANFHGDFPHGAADKGPNLGRTCKVGSYKPNAFGLYDMHGNVWEFCQDWYDKDYYATGPVKDPQGPTKSWARVVRGGGWGSSGDSCRSASRNMYVMGTREASRGFRVLAFPDVGGR